jgi:hypothetical protein
MAFLWQSFTEWFPPATRFNVDQIPDLSGKVMIVTGGYSGGISELNIYTHLITHSEQALARNAQKSASKAFVGQGNSLTHSRILATSRQECKSIHPRKVQVESRCCYRGTEERNWKERPPFHRDGSE